MVLKWFHLFEINSSKEFQAEDIVFFAIGWPILFFAIHLFVREPHTLEVTDFRMLRIRKLIGMFDFEIDPRLIRAITTGVRWISEEGSDATVIRFELEEGNL